MILYPVHLMILNNKRLKIIAKFDATCIHKYCHQKFNYKVTIF